MPALLPKGVFVLLPRGVVLVLPGLELFFTAAAALSLPAGVESRLTLPSCVILLKTLARLALRLLYPGLAFVGAASASLLPWPSLRIARDGGSGGALGDNALYDC